MSRVFLWNVVCYFEGRTWITRAWKRSTRKKICTSEGWSKQAIQDALDKNIRVSLNIVRTVKFRIFSWVVHSRNALFLLIPWKKILHCYVKLVSVPLAMRPNKSTQGKAVPVSMSTLLIILLLKMLTGNRQSEAVIPVPPLTGWRKVTREVRRFVKTVRVENLTDFEIFLSWCSLPVTCFHVMSF
jgi:hypothetical protein